MERKPMSPRRRIEELPTRKARWRIAPLRLPAGVAERAAGVPETRYRAAIPRIVGIAPARDATAHWGNLSRLRIVASHQNPGTGVARARCEIGCRGQAKSPSQAAIDCTRVINFYCMLTPQHKT